MSVLLKGGAGQKKAILDNLSKDQVDFIGELVYNILNTFPIEQKQVKRLYKKKGFKEIGNFRKTARYRNTLIKKHRRSIVDILVKYKDNLMSLVK